MFDSRKKLIVPDLLADVQHRNGRINVSSSVIANFVFDRMTDDVLSNRYLEKNGLNDIIFFNEKFEKIEGLDNKLYLNASGSDGRLINGNNPSEIDPTSPPSSIENTKIEFTSFLTGSSPFTSRNIALGDKTFLANYYFSYRPENYSSKILSRYNSKSLKLSAGSPHVAEISVNSNIKPTKSMLSGSTLSVTVPQVGSSDVTKNYSFLSFEERAKKSTQFLNLIDSEDSSGFFSIEDGRKADFSISIADFKSSPTRKVFKIDSEATKTFTTGSKTFIPNAGYDLQSRFNFYEENSEYEKAYISGSFWSVDDSFPSRPGVDLQSDAKVFINFSLSGGKRIENSPTLSPGFRITGGDVNHLGEKLTKIQTNKKEIRIVPGPSYSARQANIITLNSVGTSVAGSNGSLEIEEKIPGGSTLVINFYATAYQDLFDDVRRLGNSGSDADQNANALAVIEVQRSNSENFSTYQRDESAFWEWRDRNDESLSNETVHMTPGSNVNLDTTQLRAQLFPIHREIPINEVPDGASIARLYEYRIILPVPAGGMYYRISNSAVTSRVNDSSVGIFGFNYHYYSNASKDRTIHENSSISGNAYTGFNLERYNTDTFHAFTTSSLGMINTQDVNGIQRGVFDTSMGMSFSDPRQQAVALGTNEQWAGLTGFSSKIDVTANNIAVQQVGKKITITSTDGTKVDYFISDTAASGVAHLSPVQNGTQLRSGPVSATLSAGATRAVAVGMNLPAQTVEFVTKLKEAIEHANGHNGLIKVTKVRTDSSSFGDKISIRLFQEQGGFDSTRNEITHNLISSSTNRFSFENFHAKPMTVSLWFRYKGTQPSNSFKRTLFASQGENIKLVLHGGGAGSSDIGRVSFERYYTGNNLICKSTDKFGAFIGDEGSPQAYTDKPWTHICFTHDPSSLSNTVSLYVNGKLVELAISTTPTGNMKLEDDFVNNIGALLGAEKQYLSNINAYNVIAAEGEYSDFGFWDKILDADQVHDLYTRNFPSYRSNSSLQLHAQLGINKKSFGAKDTLTYTGTIDSNFSIEDIGNKKYGSYFFRDGGQILISRSWGSVIGSVSGSTKKMTFSAWIYDDGGIGGTILKFGSDLEFKIDSSLQLELGVNYQSNAPVTIPHKTIGKIQGKTWTHVAVSYDANDMSNMPSFYINGILQQTSLISSVPPTYSYNGPSSDDLTCEIGHSGQRVKLAEAGIWNKVLSSGEIFALYSATKSHEDNTAERVASNLAEAINSDSQINISASLFSDKVVKIEQDESIAQVTGTLTSSYPSPTNDQSLCVISYDSKPRREQGCAAFSNSVQTTKLFVDSMISDAKTLVITDHNDTTVNFTFETSASPGTNYLDIGGNNIINIRTKDTISLIRDEIAQALIANNAYSSGKVLSNLTISTHGTNEIRIDSKPKSRFTIKCPNRDDADQNTVILTDTTGFSYSLFLRKSSSAAAPAGTIEVVLDNGDTAADVAIDLEAAIESLPTPPRIGGSNAMTLANAFTSRASSDTITVTNVDFGSPPSPIIIGSNSTKFVVLVQFTGLEETAELSVSGTAISTNEISVRNVEYFFPTPKYNVPETGQKILENCFDGNGIVGPGDPRVNNTVVRYTKDDNFSHIFDSLKEAISNPRNSGHAVSGKQTIGSSVVGPTLSREFANSVMKDSKTILKLRNSDSIESNSATGKGIISWFSGSYDVSGKVPGMVISSFSQGQAKAGAMTRNSSGLTSLGKKTIIVRILEDSASGTGTIFTVSGRKTLSGVDTDISRWQLLSIDGNLEFRIRPNSASANSDYWKATINRSGLDKSKWYTLFITFDEEVFNVADSSNFIALYDSENHGGLLSSSTFSVNGSAPVGDQKAKEIPARSPVEPRLFIGYGDASSGIATNYSSNGNAQSEDFYNNFYISELSILEKRMTTEDMSKIAESHLVLRSKSGFRNELPKKLLNEKFNEPPILETEYSPFVESRELVSVYENKDVVFPSVVDSGTTGSIDFKLTNTPADNSGFSIRLPDGSDLQVIFDSSSNVFDGFTLDDNSLNLTDSNGIVAPLKSNTRFKCGLSGASTITSQVDRIQSLIKSLNRYSDIPVQSSRLSFDSFAIEMQNPGSFEQEYSGGSPVVTSLCVVTSDSNITVSNNRLSGQKKPGSKFVDISFTPRKDSIITGFSPGEISAKIKCDVSSLNDLVENSNVTLEYIEDQNRNQIISSNIIPRQLVNVQNLPRERKDVEIPRRPALEFTIHGIKYCARIDSKLSSSDSNKYNIGVEDVSTSEQLAISLSNSIIDAIAKEGLNIAFTRTGDNVILSLTENDISVSRVTFSGQGVGSVFQTTGFNPVFNHDISDESKSSLTYNKSSISATPFSDSGDIDIEDPFFAQGSYLSGLDYRFSTSFRDRVRIEIPINPVSKTTLGFTTGSTNVPTRGFSAGNYNPIGYFNFANKKWESISPSFSGKIETDRGAFSAGKSRNEAIKESVQSFQENAPIAFGGTYGFSLHRKDVSEKAVATITHIGADNETNTELSVAANRKNKSIRITSTDGTEVDFVLIDSSNANINSGTPFANGFWPGSGHSAMTTGRPELTAKDGAYAVGLFNASDNYLTIMMKLKAAIYSSPLYSKINCNINLENLIDDLGVVTLHSHITAIAILGSIANKGGNTDIYIDATENFKKQYSSGDILYLYFEDSTNRDATYGLARYIPVVVQSHSGVGDRIHVIPSDATVNGVDLGKYWTHNNPSTSLSSANFELRGLHEIKNDGTIKRFISLEQVVPGPAGNKTILNGIPGLRVDGHVKSSITIKMHKNFDYGDELTIFGNNGIPKTYGFHLSLPSNSELDRVMGFIPGSSGADNAFSTEQHMVGRTPGLNSKPSQILFGFKVPHGCNFTLSFDAHLGNVNTAANYSATPQDNAHDTDFELQYCQDINFSSQVKTVSSFFEKSNNGSAYQILTNSARGRINYQDLDFNALTGTFGQQESSFPNRYQISFSDIPPGGAYFRLIKNPGNPENAAAGSGFVSDFRFSINEGSMGVSIPISASTPISDMATLLTNALLENANVSSATTSVVNGIRQVLIELSGDHVALRDSFRYNGSSENIEIIETKLFSNNNQESSIGKYSSFHGGITKKDPNKGEEFSDSHYAELPLRGRPVSNFGFPFSDTFKPSEGQKLDLSDYLEGPFLLEKFEIICSSSIRDEVQEGIARLLPETSNDFPFSVNGQSNLNKLKFNGGVYIVDSTGSYEEKNSVSSYLGEYDERFRSIKAQRLYDRYYPETSRNSKYNVATLPTGSYMLQSSSVYHPLENKSTFTKERIELEGAYHRVGGNSYSNKESFEDYVDNNSGTVNVHEGSAWWRCDTFFLMREKPAIDTTYTIDIPSAIKTSGVPALGNAIGGSISLDLRAENTVYNPDAGINYFYDGLDWPVFNLSDAGALNWAEALAFRPSEYNLRRSGNVYINFMALSWIDVADHSPLIDPSQPNSLVSGSMYHVVTEPSNSDHLAKLPTPAYRPSSNFTGTFEGNSYANSAPVGTRTVYGVQYNKTFTVANAGTSLVGVSAGDTTMRVRELPKRVRFYLAVSDTNSSFNFPAKMPTETIHKYDQQSLYGIRYAVNLSALHSESVSIYNTIRSVYGAFQDAIDRGYITGLNMDYPVESGNTMAFNVTNAVSEDFDIDGNLTTQARVFWGGWGDGMFYYQPSPNASWGSYSSYSFASLANEGNPTNSSAIPVGATPEGLMYEGVSVDRAAIINNVETGFNIKTGSYSVTKSTRELISYAQVAYYGYANMNASSAESSYNSHYYFVNNPGSMHYRGKNYLDAGSGSLKETMEHPHHTIFGSFESTGSNGLTLLQNGLSRELNIKIGTDSYTNSGISAVYDSFSVGAPVNKIKFSIPKNIRTSGHLQQSSSILAGNGSTVLVKDTNATPQPVITNVLLGKTEFSNHDVSKAHLDSFSHPSLTASYDLHAGILNIRSECKSTPRLQNYFSYRLAVLDQYNNKDSDSLPDFANVSIQGTFIGGYDHDGLGGTKSLSSVSGDVPSENSFKFNQMPYFFDNLDNADPSLSSLKPMFSDAISTGTNFENSNAYVLEPNDKITLGFQTAIPGFHSGFTSFANLGGGNVPTELDDQGNTSTIHSGQVFISSMSLGSYEPTVIIKTSSPHGLSEGDQIFIEDVVTDFTNPRGEDGLVPEQGPLGGEGNIRYYAYPISSTVIEVYGLQNFSRPLNLGTVGNTQYYRVSGGFITKANSPSRSRAIDTGKCIESTFHPYENSKLVLYGSYLQDDIPKYPQNKKSFSSAGVVYEVFGQGDFDKFNLSLDSEFSGSMSSELISKTEISFALDSNNAINRNTVNVTFGQRTNDVGGSPKKLFTTGSVERYMSISSGQDHDFVYWDSLPVDITPYFSSGLQRDRKIVPIKFLTSGSRAQLMSRQVGENTIDDSGVGLFIGSPNLSQVTYYDDTLQSLYENISAFPTQTLNSSTTGINMGSVEPVNLMGARVGAQITFKVGLDSIIFEITGISSQNLSVKFLSANPSNTTEIANPSSGNANCRIKVEHQVDVGSKLTSDNFSEYFFQDWRKRFIFEKTFRDENGVEQNVFGNSGFDPADSKLLSRNDSNVTFGLDIESIDNFAAGFENPVPSLKILQSPNHNSGELVLSHKTTTPGIPKTYDILNDVNKKDDARAAIASIKSKSSEYQVRFDTQSSQIFASHPNLYSPAVYPDGVDQVGDSAYRQAAAILFGFGGEVNRNLETINAGSLSGTDQSYSVSFGQNINDTEDSDLILVPRASRQTLAHPKGVKYGMMNYDHIRPKVIFSRNSFGNFIDLIQGRKSAVYANVSNFDTSGEINADGRTVSIESKFFDANRALIRSGEDKLKFLFSQNLDRYQRSRSPFFDLPNPNIHTSAKGGRVRSESEITNNQVSVFNPDGNDIFDDFN